MALQRYEAGIIGAGPATVDFLAEVFELDRVPPEPFSGGTVHRLQSPGVSLKVLVTNAPPQERDRELFLTVKGLRYLTMWVDDLDATVARATARGATLFLEPTELRPGTRLAIVVDPDGNTLEIMSASPA